MNLKRLQPMLGKAIVLFCPQAFLVQSISAYCGAGLAYDAPFAAASCSGASLAAIPTSSGGGFPTSSASPFTPVSVSVLSENEIGGILTVGGDPPFLGTVGLKGALPTAGAGAVSYGCGNGAVSMISEDITTPAWAYPAAAGLYGPGYGAGFGYGPGLATGFDYGGPIARSAIAGAIAERAIDGCGCGIY